MGFMPVCMSVYYVQTCPKEAVVSPGAAMWVLGLNLSILEEEPVHLSTRPSLQS